MYSWADEGKRSIVRPHPNPLPRGEGEQERFIYMQKQKTSEKILNCARSLRRSQTPQEIILWSRLRDRTCKNLKFRRQYPIGSYILDFVCLKRKLVIELDGCQHKIKEQKTHDKLRTQFLEEEGFRVLRFWNNDVNKNLDGVIFKIEESL